jgi:hypothetical protein
MPETIDFGAYDSIAKSCTIRSPQNRALYKRKIKECSLMFQSSHERTIETETEDVCVLKQLAAKKELRTFKALMAINLPPRIGIAYKTSYKIVRNLTVDTFKSENVGPKVSLLNKPKWNKEAILD